MPFLWIEHTAIQDLFIPGGGGGREGRRGGGRGREEQEEEQEERRSSILFICLGNKSVLCRLNTDFSPLQKLCFLKPLIRRSVALITPTETCNFPQGGDTDRIKNEGAPFLPPRPRKNPSSLQISSGPEEMEG